MPIAWTLPNGTVAVTILAPDVLERERQDGEPTAAVVTRLAAGVQAKTPALAGATMTLVPSAHWPTSRAKRHAWRLVGGKVVVDPAVPEPPHPKQALLDAVTGATTVAELKAVVATLVRGQ